MIDSAADLQLRNSACNVGHDETWLACDLAIQSYCAVQGCRTSGFGFAEQAYGEATMVCLSEAVPREVAVADLAAFGTCPAPGSTAINADQRFPCAHAIHRYCKQAGFVSGFGPVGTRGDSSWTIVCLPADLAVEFPTTFGAFDELMTDCSAPSAPYLYPGSCNVASKRLCQAIGHHSGFGPVEIGSGYDTTIVCVDE